MRGLPRWLPEVASVPLDTQQSLCLTAQGSTLFPQPCHTCWEQKIKGQWAQSQEKTDLSGTEPGTSGGEGESGRLSRAQEWCVPR